MLARFTNSTGQFATIPETTAVQPGIPLTARACSV